jgi:deazaflavin-dependent oxidoreductase (nitroreductase family)
MSATQDRHRLDAVRGFNKHVLNPVMRTLAGRRHWYASALHHTGRRSGRMYVTPVVAEPVTDGFVVPLPYGSGVDWLRNIRAAGHATIDVHSRTFALTGFRVIGQDEALPLVRASRRRVWRRLHIEKFLHTSADPQE